MVMRLELEIGEVMVPARYEVCPRCDGRGKHDHPAFRNGITMDEWNGPDWDEESQASYMRGDYDVRCEKCAGARVVLVPDEAALTEEQRELVRAHREALADLAACERSERILMGDY
jgi:hypothetical protein